MVRSTYDFGFRLNAMLQQRSHVSERAFGGFQRVVAEAEGGLAADNVNGGRHGGCVGREFLARRKGELDDLGAGVVLQGAAENAVFRQWGMIFQVVDKYVFVTHLITPFLVLV
ncbi:MAG: hypothetical protein QM757_45095 [Paludibaculum sp.]